VSRPVEAKWPRVTPELLDHMKRQAESGAMSIYDRSGVVAIFEDRFAEVVGARFALATSSGTAALHSAYYGVDLGPGDEAICCDYGFFATVTPLVHVGATPVFVDSELDGTIAVDQVEAAITPATRAVVVTHMWGQPGRLTELREVCDRHGLVLIEDCSHAHGASYAGRPVGSFGDVAAWSLQANKTIWAGEGGVLCTSNREIFERAVLLGHFNKRALEDIPTDSPNHPLAFTGTGLKYRAHPLGLAMAIPQLDDLDRLIKMRHDAAAVMAEALSSVPGIDIVGGASDTVVHGYYALVATVDPDRAGFDRRDFWAALRAEGIHTVDVPRQMCSISSFPIFQCGRRVLDGQIVTDAQMLPNSHRLSSTTVKFFVPGHADDVEDASIVADAIVRVTDRLRSGVLT
jgi:perosamine synthetase